MLFTTVCSRKCIALYSLPCNFIWIDWLPYQILTSRFNFYKGSQSTWQHSYLHKVENLAHNTAIVTNRWKVGIGYTGQQDRCSTMPFWSALLAAWEVKVNFFKKAILALGARHGKSS
jgi:hypothetical protein